MNAVTVAATEGNEEVILMVNQGIHNPDENQSLMSTFQVWWSVTRLENSIIHHDSSSRLILVFHNENTHDTVINFHINGVDAGFDIRNPRDEYMERLPMYEVRIQIFWDPNNPSRSKNEKADQLSHGG